MIDSTAPTTIGVGKLRLRPSLMSAPYPPLPTSAATVTRPMTVTEAMRSPAMIVGSASGISTVNEPAHPGVAHAVGRLLHGRGHGVDPGDGVADEDQDRVADERDLRREHAEPGERDEEREQGDARDRVEDRRAPG